MSKSLSYIYTGTLGHIVSTAHSLPKNPNTLLKNGWEEITHPSAAKNSNTRVFKEKDTGLRIVFDKKVDGAPGFKGKDHYHIKNPNATNSKDMYIDKNGNVVGKTSKKSHILPEGD